MTAWRCREVISVVAILAICLGCSTTHVVVGKTRPPTDPKDVKVFAAPPKQYEKIAVISTDSTGSFRFGAQGKVDAALERAKRDAAKLGANGLLLQKIGESANVSFDAPGPSGQNAAADSQADATLKSTYNGGSSGGLVKTVQAMAIWVIEE